MKKRMKKAFCMLVTLAMLCMLLPVGISAQEDERYAVWDGTVAGGFAAGTGTQDDPYQIQTPAQLAYLAFTVNGGNSYAGQYIRVMNDLTLNDFSENADPDKMPSIFPVIGTSSEHCFSGVFDGGAYSISGLAVANTSLQGSGLFGFVKNAEIRNVALDAAIIVCSSLAGTVAASGENSKIDNCTVSALETFCDSPYFGGIIGDSVATTVTNCYVLNSTVQNLGNFMDETDIQSYTGGIAGRMSEGAGIQNCAYVASVIMGSGHAGGLVGYLGSGCTISESFNAGLVNSAYCGGLAGFAEGSFAVTNSYNAGMALGEKLSGGLAGSVEGAQAAVFENCFNTSNVYTAKKAGGLCGSVSGCTFRNCYNAGEVLYEDNGESVNPVLHGLFGSADSCTAENVYYLSGDDTFGTKLTPEQMQNAASFQGFDFDTVWEFAPDGSCASPVLRNIVFQQGPRAVGGLRGDVNGDGEVNDADVILLKRYISKWNVQVDASTADADGDGEIGDSDVILLKRTISNWNIVSEVGLPVILY